MEVLVVEDSQLTRQLVVRMLRTIEGVVVTEAADGAQALAALGTRRVDVVVTDLSMPVVDGYALIEKIRADPRLAATPIVVLTTEGALVERTRAEQLGIAAYVTKPVRPDALVAAVLAAAQNRRE